MDDYDLHPGWPVPPSWPRGTVPAERIERDPWLPPRRDPRTYEQRMRDADEKARAR